MSSTAQPLRLRSEPYESWSIQYLFDIFRRMIARDAPYDDIEDVLATYKSHFTDVVEKVRFEHRFVPNRYFRTEDKVGFINPLNMDHFTRVLHYFAQSIYSVDPAAEPLLDVLFYTMKTRCTMNLFYKQSVSDFFFPSHSIATVVGYGRWGRFLVIKQGCTIGVNNSKTRDYPEIGDAVIIHPGATILGGCRIGHNARIGAGTFLINTDVPDNTLVFGRYPDLVFKANHQSNLEDAFDHAALLEAGLI